MGFLRRTALGIGQKLFGGLFSKADDVGQAAAQRALQSGILKDGVDVATAASAMSGVGKPSFFGSLLKWGGLGVAAEYLTRGNDGLVGGIANQAWTHIGKIEAELNATGFWHGFLKNIQEFLKIFGVEFEFLNNALENTGQKDNAATRLVDDITLNGEAGNLNTLTRTVGTPLGELTGMDKTAAGITTAVGAGSLYGLRSMLSGGGLSNLASNAPSMTLAKGKNFLSKIPVVGKYLGVAAVVGGGAAALMTPTPADASVLNGDSGAITTTQEAINEAGTEIAAIGASAIAAVPASGAVASMASGTAIFAGKQIPGLGAIFAAGDAIYDTAKHALRGDFDKAGTRAVAGVGETVAGLGGFLTYGTLGTAWREAVREGGKMIFGADRAIDNSYVVQAGKLAYDFATARDDVAMDANPQQLTIDQLRAQHSNGLNYAMN